MNIFQLYQMAQQSGNIFGYIRNMAGNDEQAISFINNLERTDPSKWQEIATNYAQSKGTTINKVLNRFGF